MKNINKSIKRIGKETKESDCVRGSLQKCIKHQKKSEQIPYGHKKDNYPSFPPPPKKASLSGIFFFLLAPLFSSTV